MKQKIYLVALLLLVFSGSGVMAQKTTGGGELKVMTYNVLKGFSGAQSLKDKFVTWISKDVPDIIVYEELSRFNDGMLSDLCKEFGHRYTAFFDTKSGFPVGISSKYPINNIQRIKEDFHHGVMMAKVLDYNIVVLHLSPFSWEKRYDEIGKIVQRLQTLPAGEKTLVMGDFNARSPLDSMVYNANPEVLERAVKAKSKNINNEGKYDYTVIEQMSKAGFIDCLKQLNSAFEYTCPTPLYASASIDGRSRIDYIWASPALKSQLKKCEVSRNWYTDFLSDHYPVLLTLTH
ncbi:endonuclease/exonuclease/phosphatase family protein [Pseudopedobacter beijingensis]|uniref:Endonuclease/exonuclease/phosphatase family protein n=1 Tax=Pseudopedobacter beijingensis TaxID=1207056 RepID=A0ABW4IEP2_9SPHI